MNNGSETTEIPEIKLYNECDFNNVAIHISINHISLCISNTIA